MRGRGWSRLRPPVLTEGRVEEVGIEAVEVEPVVERHHHLEDAPVERGIAHEAVDLLREARGALGPRGLCEDVACAPLQGAPRLAIERGLAVVVDCDRRGGARDVEVVAEGVVPGPCGRGDRRERAGGEV